MNNEVYGFWPIFFGIVDRSWVLGKSMSIRDYKSGYLRLKWFFLCLEVINKYWFKWERAIFLIHKIYHDFTKIQIKGNTWWAPSYPHLTFVSFVQSSCTAQTNSVMITDFTRILNKYYITQQAHHYVLPCLNNDNQTHVASEYSRTTDQHSQISRQNRKTLKFYSLHSNILLHHKFSQDIRF